MVEIHNAAEPDPLAAKNTGVDRSGIKSEGQKLLDRQLAVRNRLRNVLDRMDVVKASITSPTFEHASDSSTSTSASSFFEGLSLMTDEFERVAAEIEASVEDLAKLF